MKATGVGATVEPTSSQRPASITHPRSGYTRWADRRTESRPLVGGGGGGGGGGGLCDYIMMLVHSISETATVKKLPDIRSVGSLSRPGINRIRDVAV
ncbi:hypothetical protein EYF80_032647 [Liparis tanakae]|uniref:Uncharacterized protein n=1 Tax=Liparis tanakae TaxID=230148 RepID=A0A4Z2GX22_9TELE|nr:hypothetical protein EYF80_032647 [Liparis tanakae]